jgi:hypothetical protein
MRVHCFYLKLVNKVLYGQKHCLLPRENSHNQSQQVKARTAQKSSNLTEKVRRKAGYFPVKTGKVQFLQMPAFSRSFVQQIPDFILQMPDFNAPQQLAIFSFFNNK